MNKLQATARAAALQSTVKRLQKVEAKTAKALQQAQAAQTMASESYSIAWNNHRAAWNSYALAMLEAERLDNLANADAYPEHRAHYLAEAAKRSKVRAILSASTGAQEVAA